MEKHLALEALVELTNRNLGYIPSSPTEFNELSLEIQRKTDRPISPSSIKRIWGYVNYDGFPTQTTLNNLARYNGFRDWESFQTSHPISSANENSGFIEETLINTDTLRQGDRLFLKWNVGKSLEIECISHMTFRINTSRNIKLQAGDIISIHTLCVGHPVYVSNIRRGDQCIPAYIGAKKGGITNITFLPADSRE